MRASIVVSSGREFAGRLVEHRGNGVIVIVYKGKRVAGISASLPNARERAKVRA